MGLVRSERSHLSDNDILLPSDGVDWDTGGESGHRLKNVSQAEKMIFVANGINSVGDYNSSPGGCRRRRRLSVCLTVCVSVCPHFFSRFTMG